MEQISFPFYCTAKRQIRHTVPPEHDVPARQSQMAVGECQHFSSVLTISVTTAVPQENQSLSA